MPWLPSKGFDQLAQEAFQRGIWEDLGNGYLTKKPKPKQTDVLVIADNEPDDHGKVRLKIEAVNAGNSPKIHYQEDGEVTQQSPVLTDNVLVTNALKVQLIAIDPTDKNQTGNPKTWTNTLVIRNRFNEISRQVELFVAPKGSIRYTLDGSEPRNGLSYTGPITIGDQAAKISVFAECEDLEATRHYDPKNAGGFMQRPPPKPD